MRNSVFCVAPVLLLIINLCSAQTVTRDDYLKGYEERARFISAAFDTASGGYAAVAARYAKNVEVARADSMFIAALKEPRGDMFWMFPVIGAYMHGKDKMSPGAKAAVRNAWKTYAPYRGDTENHWAMYYASLFLAAEQWPGLPGTEWFNGKTSDENLVDAREYLVHWMKITTTIGQGEFDSPDYFAEYAISMNLLADFAQDPGIRERGAMMFEYVLADFAVEHLDGQYLGGFSRIYQPAVFMPLNSSASAFAYLYFGSGKPVVSSWTLLPALSKFRMPQIIYHIATDRSASYIHRERKRVRNVIRFGPEKNPPVYKYTYVTKDYGLGSLQGGLLQPIQQHTWGVRYLYGRPYTTLFGLHPYWSSYELGMFFPEELKPLISDVVASKGTYNNPDKWTGGSPFERTFQQKNTLIVLYDIKPGTMTEHIDGFFPRNLEERVVDPSGWILCKAGDTYIGWFPLQEYEWIEEKDVQGVVKPGVGIPENVPKHQETGNWRLRSHKLQNGYVIEVRSKDEIGSFEKFSGLLRTRIPQATLKPGAVSVRYRTINNDQMKFTFPETRVLNGKAVDLSRTPLFQGPFLNADTGSEKLVMTYKGQRRILDFKAGKITGE
ncbi:MAG: hypothetical protein H6Q30_262 [Bacteroidetes bacterium]|jgi:hypothetical protein|nr:hypothetical protein [Bacteroidota bacterium]